MISPAVPILYSFRRCPYAMRARMGLTYAKQTVELREVVLKDKPEAMLKLSPKGTVPVLVIYGDTEEEKIIDESLDVLIWALEQNDPDEWLPSDAKLRAEQLSLIEHNDTRFKLHLDHYKYADRFPEHSADFYRSQGEAFLRILETKLSNTTYLFGETCSFADIAIFPFIRQFAHVDKTWFDQANYPKLQTWLNHFLQSELFKRIMPKFEKWLPGADPIYL